MPRFSGRSTRALNTAHPDLQTLFGYVIKYLDVTILEGIRGKDRQNRLKAEGKTQVSWPNSNHNVCAVPHPPEDYNPDDPSKASMAVDVAPYPIDWDDTQRFMEMGLYVLGTADALFQSGRMNHRVRWGGDWDRDLVPVPRDPDESFFDSPHFELVDE